MDNNINSRDGRKGEVLLFTGNGKGKSSAAFGTALRAMGWGWQVAVIQFAKGGWETGEKRFADTFGGKIEFSATLSGTEWFSHLPAAEKLRSVRAGLALADKYITAGKTDLLILDEINAITNAGLAEPEQIIRIIAGRPKWMSIIMTGRDAPPKLIEYADLVTEMKEIKHPFNAGISAIKGLDY